MHNILEIDSIVKNYGTRTILSDVHLKCETKDIIGLFGRNGTGKTTLLKIIFGIEPADYKHLKINGIISPTPYLLKECISYLPQVSFIPKHFTVKKAAELFLGINHNDIFFNDINIYKIVDNKIKDLSGGELRYLEIKLVLLQKSRFVMLDEPFAGLSPIIIEDVKGLIVKSSETKGVIITDHNYLDVLDICTKKYLVRDCSCKLTSDQEDLKKYGYLQPNLTNEITTTK
ncbi:ATP-binding cassette domain-containing protein [Flavobacterium sp. HJSW_4]|uniref:ATP-binding cassette domain-containing protein n=1 Tax=Flavobacterium sp. HJSW_4 TaxID=3344660 RepID=UPI0035F2D262